jgi:hypothetical protein
MDCVSRKVRRWLVVNKTRREVPRRGYCAGLDCGSMAGLLSVKTF